MSSPGFFHTWDSGLNSVPETTLVHEISLVITLPFPAAATLQSSLMEAFRQGNSQMVGSVIGSVQVTAG